MTPSPGTAIAIGVALVLTTAVSHAHVSKKCSIVVSRTWIQKVLNPELSFPPFETLLSLHPGGTATETNTTLPAATVPPLTGSDGHGSIDQTQLSFAVAPTGAFPEQAHAGLFDAVVAEVVEIHRRTGPRHRAFPTLEASSARVSRRRS